MAGYRTVPVELGSRYTDEQWSQKLMTVSEFVDNHVIPDVSGHLEGWSARGVGLLEGLPCTLR